MANAQLLACNEPRICQCSLTPNPGPAGVNMITRMITVDTLEQYREQIVLDVGHYVWSYCRGSFSAIWRDPNPIYADSGWTSTFNLAFFGVGFDADGVQHLPTFFRDTQEEVHRECVGGELFSPAGGVEFGFKDPRVVIHDDEFAPYMERFGFGDYKPSFVLKRIIPIVRTREIGFKNFSSEPLNQCGYTSHLINPDPAHWWRVDIQSRLNGATVVDHVAAFVPVNSPASFDVYPIPGSDTETWNAPEGSMVVDIKEHGSGILLESKTYDIRPTWELAPDREADPAIRVWWWTDVSPGVYEAEITIRTINRGLGWVRGVCEIFGPVIGYTYVYNAMGNPVLTPIADPFQVNPKFTPLPDSDYNLNYLRFKCRLTSLSSTIRLEYRNPPNAARSVYAQVNLQNAQKV